jgi:hypothetical protein
LERAKVSTDLEESIGGTGLAAKEVRVETTVR